jgi:signal transduction histidine kinase
MRSAERLGPSGALNSAYLLYAFILASLGLRKRVAHYVRAADGIARATRDPAVYARSLQISAAVAAWSGDTREALAIGARSLEEYGHWREISEFCMTAYNQQQIEGVRGRCLEGWRHLQHAVSKLSKHEGPPMALEFIEHSVRAALTALGRGKDAEPLLARLSSVTTRPPSRGSVLVTSYGSLVRRFTESGNLGRDFEALVAEVKALKLNPKKVHLEVVEYYVHVAHARVHACLRAPEAERPESLRALDEALGELRKAARIPLIRAHALAGEGWRALLGNDAKRAEELFDRAYAVGTSEGMPWILYAVHRGRAHLERMRGVTEAAMDHARLAETLATEHGASHRARWVREEFSLRQRFVQGSSGLSPPSLIGSLTWEDLQSKGRFGPRGYLKALVRMGQHAAREFGFMEQARVVLGELIEVARADRGLLFLSSERLAQERELPGSVDPSSDASGAQASDPKGMVPIAGQNADGSALRQEPQYHHQILDEALSGQQHADDAGLPNVVWAVHDDRAVICASLMIRGERIGAVYLDRSASSGPFSEADSRALAALAIQVPLVFELARFLRERERVEETQRSAEKLEAIGRLAGGIAHDFNNMLSVILGVSDQILGNRSTRSLVDDIKTVQSAAERARDLTRQLLAFSRGQYLRPEVLHLNELIQRLDPILRQLVGDGTGLTLSLAPDLCRVKADPAQIDQVLTNLVVNARDAMPNGGHLSIETSNQILHSGRATADIGLPAGRYAQITVTDTGIGMDGETLAKMFEPFFTTKPAGNGLGLPTAYGIVKQSGGHIDVDSSPGKGTTFRILLPETEQRLSVPAPSQRGEPTGSETVLLVDDEPLVREATRRTLRSLGYQVVGAKSAEEALRLVAEQGDSIRLVITDVMMPGMNGLELARELGKVRPSLKILFISGYTAGVLAERGFLSDNVDFVQKPVSRDALAQRLRDLLDAVPRA